MGKNLKGGVVMVYLKVILWNFTAERRKSYGNQVDKIRPHTSGNGPVNNKRLGVTLIQVTCYVRPDNVHQLHVQQPSTYEKPEAASEVLGS
jgi:hypothetical protein